MAVSKFSDLFEDKLSEEQITQFHEQQDLNRLIELARQYNELETILPVNRIDIEAMKDDKLKLLVSLWIRNITVPSHLNIGYGEPFDGKFRDWAYGGGNEEDGYEPVENNSIYKLLNHPENLLWFIIGALQVNEMGGIKRFNQDSRSRINLELGKLGYPPIENKLELVGILKRMRPIELVYMFLVLSETGAVGTYIADYTDII